MLHQVAHEVFFLLGVAYARDVAPAVSFSGSYA
jgi:hypothetical protein